MDKFRCDLNRPPAGIYFLRLAIPNNAKAIGVSPKTPCGQKLPEFKQLLSWQDFARQRPACTRRPIDGGKPPYQVQNPLKTIGR